MDQPTGWEVPAVSSNYAKGFATTTESDGNKQWVLLDIDGDGYPDLVQTCDPATGKVWGKDGGTPHWRVYKKASNAWGFSTTPVQWPVPDSQTADGFDAAVSGKAGKNWVTIDLDGDGKVDLVQTSTIGVNKVWGAGQPNPYWKLFKNTGAGFSTTATIFLVPQSGFEDGFYTIANSTGYKHWTLADTDGDGRLDLVHTADPADGKVWQSMAGGASPMKTVPGIGGAGVGVLVQKPYWKVYRGVP